MEWVSRLAGMCSVLGGLAVLAGWQFRIDILRIPPGEAGVNVAPYSALCLILLGLALLLMERRSRFARVVAAVCAFTTAGVAGIQTAEYLGLPDTGFDRLFFSHRLEGWNVPTPVGRMALFTALAFLSLSASILLQIKELGGKLRAVPTVVVVPAAVTVFSSLLAYAYGGEDFGVGGARMSLYTAVVLATLIAGVVAADRRGPFLQLVLDPGAAGLVTRRLLLASIAALVLLGWLRTLLRNRNELGSEMATAMMVLVAAVIFAALILHTGNVLQRAQSELRESEERLRAIVDTTPECVKVVAPDGTLLHMNSAGLNMVGADCPELALGRNVYDVIAPHDRERFRAFHERVCAGERGTLEFEIVGFTGIRRHMETHAVPLRNADGSMLHLAVTRDVTERRQTEERLRRTEKLAVSGRMAATIAHEINNPLEAVTNLLFLLRSHVAHGDGSKYLDMAEHELGRVAEITKQTLAFYREHSKPEMTEVSAIIDNVLAVFTTRIAEKRIMVSRNEEPCAILARRGELTQLLSNLVGNAIDAVGPKGRLQITVRGKDSDVLVSVADNGGGIPADQLQQIFDPFFTTKQIGTGLGLWVAQEIAQKHGGRITVESSTDERTHGTTFHVWLAGAARATGNANSSSAA